MKIAFMLVLMVLVIGSVAGGVVSQTFSGINVALSGVIQPK